MMSCCLKLEANSGTGHWGQGLPGRYTIHCGPLEFKPLENSGILCGTSLWVISPSPQRWESWGIDPPNPIHHVLRAVLRAIHSQHPWPIPKMESPRCKATGACRNAGFLEPEQGVLSSCYNSSIPCPCLSLTQQSTLTIREVVAGIQMWQLRIMSWKLSRCRRVCLSGKIIFFILTKIKSNPSLF